MLKIRTLCFGRISEVIGERVFEVTLPDGATAGEVSEQLLNRFPTLSNTRMFLAVNQSHAQSEQLLSDGDEVAIFTAVSGG